METSNLIFGIFVTGDTIECGFYIYCHRSVTTLCRMFFLSPCSFSSKSRVEQSSSIRNPLLQCTNSSGRLCAQSLPPEFDRNTTDSHCLLLGQSRGDSLHHLRLYSRSQSDHLIWRRHEAGNNPFPTPLVLPPLLPASWILKHESDAWQKIWILLMVTLLFV